MRDQNTEFFGVLPELFVVFTQALRGGEQLLADLRVSVAHGLGAYLITVSQAVGTNELDVGDPDEAEQHLQVVFVGNAGCLTDMQAAGGGDDHDFFATAQAFRAGFGVTEGLTGNGNAIDPGLELGRDGEVVHRRGDDDGIGSQELSQGGSAQFRFVLLSGVAQFSSSACGDQGRGGEMADGIGGQVAVGHDSCRFGGLPGFNDFAAQLTGSRVVTKNARIDMQQFHVGSPGEDRHGAI